LAREEDPQFLRLPSPCAEFSSPCEAAKVPYLDLSGDLSKDPHLDFGCIHFLKVKKPSQKQSKFASYEAASSMEHIKFPV
jgi:hypothetical protein